MIELGLIGTTNSAIARSKIEAEFMIGHGSSKTFLKRINLLKLSKEEILKRMKEIVDGTNSNS